MERYYRSAVYIYFSLFFTIFYTLVLLTLIPLIQRPIQYTNTKWIDSTAIFSINNESLIKTGWTHDCRNISTEHCDQELCNLAKGYNENITTDYIIAIMPNKELLASNTCEMRGTKVQFADGISHVFSLIILVMLLGFIIGNALYFKAKWVLLTLHTIMSILLLLYSLVGTFYFIIPGYQDVETYTMIVIQTIAWYFAVTVYALTMTIMLMRHLTKYCCKPHGRLPNMASIYENYENSYK